MICPFHSVLCAFSNPVWVLADRSACLTVRCVKPPSRGKIDDDDLCIFVDDTIPCSYYDFDCSNGFVYEAVVSDDGMKEIFINCKDRFSCPHECR